MKILKPKNRWYGDQPPAGDPPKADPPKTDPPKTDPPGPVPYDRFKEVLDGKNALEARLKKLEDLQKTAQEEELKKTQQWEQLAKQREEELKAEKINRLRLEVASKKGLPVELAARLQGDTLEALEKDAEGLLPLLKPKAPGVPPPGPKGSAGDLDISKMSPKEIREHSAKLMEQARGK
jgi:hypothetical protein